MIESEIRNREALQLILSQHFCDANVALSLYDNVKKVIKFINHTSDLIKNFSDGLTTFFLAGLARVDGVAWSIRR